MIWKIARKEFLLNLMTFKFALGTILCVVLMIVFMPVLVNDYQQRLKDYHANVSATQAELQKAKVYDTLLLGWKHFVYRPPTIFSVFSKDVANQVGDSVGIGYFRVPELSAGSKEVNPYISILPTLDISLIFKIIISVLALLVACDVISNERERGTLKLMLSAGVARYQVLSGKLLAGLMTLFIPVTIAFITGLLFWQFSPMVDLTGVDWARIALLYFASLIFISVMYHFGLFASCLTKRSSASLLLTLFFWMFFIVVLPNASLHLATFMRPLGPEDAIDERLNDVRERQKKESRELEKQVPFKGEMIDIDEGMGRFYVICDQEAIEAQQKRNAVLEPLNIRHVEERWEVRHTAIENLFKQKRLADAFSWASPVCLYGAVTSALAGTDASSCQDFIRASREYRKEVIDYIRLKTDNNLSGFRSQADQLYKLAFYNHEIWRKPKPLTFCVGGQEKSLPNCFGTDAFNSAWWVKGQHNFLLRQFGDLDWVFIISLPLSFMALFLTYDSICGEREAGTLRLILSRPIPRSKILLGKYSSAMITIGIPLFIGLFVNLIIAYSSGVIELNANDWFKLFVIVLLSILYLSIFVLLGIFISSRSAYSTNSMVVLLLLWVGLVILIPCLGRTVSDVFYKAPSNAVWIRKYSEMLDQLDREAKGGKFGKNATGWNPDPNHPSVHPPAAARYWNAFSNGVMQQREDGHNQRVAQALAGRRYSCLSPMILYQQASEAIAGTGIHRCRNLWEQIKRYRNQLKDYILSQDAEDPDSLHLLFCIDDLVKDWNAISKKPVDFDTVPKFQEKDWAFGESLRLAVWDIGLLALFNLAFFVASWVSFMKYDVR